MKLTCSPGVETMCHTLVRCHTPQHCARSSLCCLFRCLCEPSQLSIPFFCVLPCRIPHNLGEFLPHQLTCKPSPACTPCISSSLCVVAAASYAIFCVQCLVLGAPQVLFGFCVLHTVVLSWLYGNPLSWCHSSNLTHSAHVCFVFLPARQSADLLFLDVLIVVSSEDRFSLIRSHYQLWLCT